ncbi:O-antigen polymerase [Psychrobacter faecalis]
MLVILNFIAWFWVVFFLKGLTRNLYLLSAIMFGQSYFFLSGFVFLFGYEYPTIIPSAYIDSALFYSFIAGCFYSLVFYLTVSKKDIIIDYKFKRAFLYFFSFIPRSAFFIFFVLLLLAFIWWRIYDISYYTGMYDRGEWWYGDHNLKSKFNFTPPALLVSFLVMGLTKTFYKNKYLVLFLNFLLVFSIVFLVSFDGSRRELLLPLLSFFMCGLYLYFNRSRFVAKLYFFIFLIIVLFISYISLGRSIVGWYALFNKIEFSIVDFFVSILSPMPTLNVTARMLEYTEYNGYQGVSGYFSALINTAFPNFLVGSYVGGDPVVTKIHNELGWRGFDFGFLAESIYAGGIFLVIIMHSIVAYYHAFLINRVSTKNFSYALFFLLSFQLALVQALRSDFMNLLKWSIYPALAISLIYFIFKKVIR